MTKTIVGVMGPGDEKTSEKLLQHAHELGKAIAEHGWVLLTGGRNRGVMDSACKGAKEAGGTTIGILPSADLTEMSSAVDIPIITGLGSARDNINALSANVLVAVGMGPGTAAEVALALKAKKAVVLLEAGQEAQAFFSGLAPEHVHVAKDVAGAVAHVTALLAK